MDNTKKIIFINYNAEADSYQASPVPTIKALPDWYKKFPKYLNSVNSISSSTVKNCVPFFDAMSAGYVFTTPCDISFYQENGLPKFQILDYNFKNFIDYREPMNHFPKISGYHDHHFHWLPDWGVSLPEGYSALYVSPINMYDLPFLTTSGIVDNDKSNINGKVPFFIKENFHGIIKRGTPYIQVIPFKRDDWESEVIMLDKDGISSEYKKATEKYREVDSNGYRDVDWSRKRYE